MSTWTPEHAERAEAEGWNLYEVVDGSKVYLKAFPKGEWTDTPLDRYLVERARSRSELHIHALRCVMASQLGPNISATKRKKR